ncbi:protein terminal ear1-like [Wolffia australiana]
MAVQGQPPSTAAITAKMAEAPPFRPQRDWFFLSRTGFHCFLYRPLPWGTWAWTKQGALSSPSSSPSSSSSSGWMELHGEDGTRTTVMIKNVPNKYSREMLVKLLDEHCAEENGRRATEEEPPSQYDFVYLPMDFSTNCCLGYGFVNFTSGEAAGRFRRAMENRRWGLFRSNKVTQICYARIQGKEAMVANFSGSSFRCDSDECLPAVFSPPRGGAAPPPPPTVVGRRWPRSAPAAFTAGQRNP